MTTACSHCLQPEMFREERYGIKVDVYSYGICVWELASRAFPFERMTPLQIINGVCDGMRPVRATPACHHPRARRARRGSGWREAGGVRNVGGH